MIPSLREQLDRLSNHFTQRREAILAAWRNAAKADPEQTTAHSLTRGQFNDHIPQVLDAFERRLRARPEDENARIAVADQKKEEVKHGLHRWQQGYRLRELMHEWGHLQACLFDEIENFARDRPDFSRDAQSEAIRQMITLVNEAIAESTGQYERLQQAEAAGRLGDLERAIAGLRELETKRAAMLHQAVHDLRSNVQSVKSAAEILSEATIKDADRLEFAALVQQGVESVGSMLGELMELARLEAGQDRRELTTFDAAAVLRELCNVSRPIARERGLELETAGPAVLTVVSDPGKVRRLLQNLLLNALKYTLKGGVLVSWGEEPAHWWLVVKDTGPGIMAGPGAPLLIGLNEATASAREADEKAAALKGEVSHVLEPVAGAVTPPRPSHQQAGEGIGLSIVKRLCELLDASLELSSTVGVGTTFRIVFPRRYSDLGPGP